MPKSSRFSGQLYQFSHPTRLFDGAYVRIDGPHDTFGRVVSSAPAPEGGHLHQVRGVKPVRGERPVANF